MRTTRLRDSLRIIWALTVKDLVDGLKNKTIISLVIVVIGTAAMYRALPLLHASDPMHLWVHGPGRSSLVAALDASELVAAYDIESEAKMMELVAEQELPELGLVVPTKGQGANNPLVITAYTVCWAKMDQVEEAMLLAEDEINALWDRAARIELAAERAYPDTVADGRPFIAALSVILSTTLVSVSLIPNMMLEENVARTMDVIRVSPATTTHYVLGKALAGAIYGALTVVITWSLNLEVVNHWWMAILASLCGLGLSTALGLILGTMVKSRQALQLWAWVVILPLQIPVFLSIMGDLFPASLMRIINWIPTVALSRLLRAAAVETITWGQIGAELIVVVATILVVGTTAALIIRKQEG